MATYTFPPTVNMNRNTTFRRMDQMNGDNLTQLKNPPRAEVSRRVLGHIESHQAGLKKQLALWYKEQNFIVNKINRNQAKVYKTFLRANYEQKRLERLAREKQRQREFQEKLRNTGNDADKDAGDSFAPASEEAASPSDVDIKKQDNNFKKENVLEEYPAAILAGNAPAVGQKSSVSKRRKYNRHRSEFPVLVKAPASLEVEKEEEKEEVVISGHCGTNQRQVQKASASKLPRQAKVLVVRKQTPEGSRIREDSLLSKKGPSFINENNRSFIQERSGSIYIQTVTMGNENTGIIETDAKDHLENSENADNTLTGNLSPIATIARTNTPSTMPTQPAASIDSPRKSVRYKLRDLRIPSRTKKPPPPTSYTLSVIEKSKRMEKQSLYEGASNLLNRPDHDVGLRGLEHVNDDFSLAETKDDPVISIAEENRRRRQHRMKSRKEQLDRETPIIYERNEKGDIVPSGYDFKRRAFKRPSSKEKKTRIKLLHRSRETMKQERDKVVEYIDKLSEQERLERLERERRMKQKELDAATAKLEAKKLREAETDPGVLLRSLIRAFRKGGSQLVNEDPNSVPSLQQCTYIRQYRHDRDGQEQEKVSSWNQSGDNVYP